MQQSPPTPQPSQTVDVALIIDACQTRLRSLQSVYEQQRQRCAIIKDSLKEAESMREDTASRVSEIGEQIAFLKTLPAMSVPAPGSDSILDV